METNQKTLNTMWYGSARILVSIVSGAVLVFDIITKKFLCHIGIGIGEGRVEDTIKQITDTGNMVNVATAVGIFGDYNYTFEGEVYSLKDNYKTD